MKRILCVIVAVVGMCEISNGMQKAVTSSPSIYRKEISSPFAFIGEKPILEDTSSDLSETAQKIVLLSEEELDKFLESTDLSESELKKLELVSPEIPRIEALEQAFFGNETLYQEFSLIKEKITPNEKLSFSQKNFLNWLIQNPRGDSECAKMLVTFYSFTKQALMFSFWRHVALFFNLPASKI